VLSSFLFAFGCNGSGDGSGSGGDSSGSSNVSSQTSGASTTTGSASVEACGAATTQTACLAVTDGQPSSPARCYWIRGYVFPMSADVCVSASASCTGIPTFERCIFEDQNEFAMMPIRIHKQEGQSKLVAQFFGIPTDDDIPGWVLGCENEPTDCVW
jgi:hypothetical protein